MRSAFLWFLAASVASGGCGDDATPSDAGPDAQADAPEPDAGPTGPIEVTFDLAANVTVFDRPWPLDAIRKPDGHPDLSGYPNPRHLAIVNEFIGAIESDLDGFSPSGPVYMHFTGPLDASQVPTDAASTRDDPDSPVMLVDIDPDSPDRGRRYPIVVSLTDHDESYRPANLLQLLPAQGINLREGTLHAAIVRSSIGSGDPARPLAQAPALAELLTGATPDGDLGAQTAADFAPLLAWLDEAGIPRDDVVAATVYRTAHATDQLYGLAAWAAEQAARTPTELPRKILEMPEYCAYQGAWTAPQYQEGTPPYSSVEDGGRMILDGDGLPVEQRTERVPFVVTVPRTVMPASGYPLLFYVNGTGGLTRQIIDRGVSTPTSPPEPGTGPAQIVARQGFAASGMAGPLTPERVPGASGYEAYNFFNPVAMRDNFKQMVLEHIFFRRLLLALHLDVSDCPGADTSAATDGLAAYDPDVMVVMGQSLGSYLAGMLATLDPGYKAAILTGAGASFIEYAFGVRDPVDTAAITRAILSLTGVDTADVWHPGLGLFDLALAPSTNLLFVDDILRYPRDGVTPPHVLVIEGDDDDNIGPGLQRALVAGVGVDLVGEEVGAPADQILGWIELAGGMRRDPPVSLNFTTSDGPRTAGVVRYLPDRDDGGHYVTFQLEGPKHQYGCFLRTLLDTGTPVILAPGAVDDPCE